MFKLIKYEKLYEIDQSTKPHKEDTIETSIIFPTNNKLKMDILRFLQMSDISTGALKVENNPNAKQTIIRVFNTTMEEMIELLGDSQIAEKIVLKDSSKRIMDIFK